MEFKLKIEIDDGHAIYEEYTNITKSTCKTCKDGHVYWDGTDEATGNHVPMRSPCPDCHMEIPPDAIDEDGWYLCKGCEREQQVKGGEDGQA